MDKSQIPSLSLKSIPQNSSNSLDSRLQKLESLQKLSTDLLHLSKQDKSLKASRTELSLKDLENRASLIEEKDLQKLVEIGHQCELHTIHLQQTEGIKSIKSDLEEISFNIANDDRINIMTEEWQEKLVSMCGSLENMSKRIGGLSVFQLNQEVQYLQRGITEERIRKEQEEVKLELVQEQIDIVARRVLGMDTENTENEQELFLQAISGVKE